MLKRNNYLQLSLLLALLVFASGLKARDVAKQIYQSCAACHGDKAQGNPKLNAPALAGQHDWYLQAQLQNFQNGKRGSHEKDVNGKAMLSFSMQVTDFEQLTALTTYLEALPPPPTTEKLKGNAKKGAGYYHGKCGACHGSNGQGNKAFNAPKLVGLQGDYFKRQIHNYQNAIRGYHPEDKYGRQMALMSKTVTDKELADIIFYLSVQK